MRLLAAVLGGFLWFGSAAQAQTEVGTCDAEFGDPVSVDVTAIPMVVTSTTEDYFVLYVLHDVDADTTVRIPVAVVRGETGSTTLAENVEALPADRYRVEKYRVDDPGDVDGDCIDDITELDGNLVDMNPVNAAPEIDFTDGAVGVPDRETFEQLSRETNGEFHGKFNLTGENTARPKVYFPNSNTHRYHYDFQEAVGLPPNAHETIVGQISYYPDLEAPDGSEGAYVFRYSGVSGLRNYYPFSVVAHTYTAIAASMPFLADDLVYHMVNRLLPTTRNDLPLYEDSRIDLVFDEDVEPESGFLALNTGEGYGFLRVMEPDERPSPRDIVIYEDALPNTLPRVAGIITSVLQTPLSHVNLRAVQDGIPNAYIRDALGYNAISHFLDGYVRYTVTETGWDIHAATPAEVDTHHDASRPAHPQTPQRDLSVQAITPLSDIGFDDWTAFGVKAANVAVLGTLGFPEGTVPDGFAIPVLLLRQVHAGHGSRGGNRAWEAEWSRR